MASSFELDIAKYVAAAKGDLNAATRRVVLTMFSKVIEKSPVGNPDIWAANKHAMGAREAARVGAAAVGKKISNRTLAKRFPLATGQGYVGGRFKSNWVVGINAIPTDIPGTISPADSAARVGAAIPLVKAGDQVTICNNLIYSNTLEFGHSTQAPSGMVRITAMEFGAVVKAAESSITPK